MLLPEVRLARRLLSKRQLVPPIDVLALLRSYASVEFVDFPVEIDGLCLNLKAVGRQPTVFVKRQASGTRQRFTMAHELGHVLIPWHIGTIIDEIDVGAAFSGRYWEHETEANNFASELLMPEDWALLQTRQSNDPLAAILRITESAQVSRQAAAIKVANCLPPNYVIACSVNGVVNWCLRSRGTLAAQIAIGSDLNAAEPYPFPSETWTKSFGGVDYHCWHFLSIKPSASGQAEKPWRAILDEIVGQIIPVPQERSIFKSSVNGVTANANGMVRSNRTVEAIATAMIQRLHANAADRQPYRHLVNHPLFLDFCYARAKEYAMRA